jgi:hypothetical protein
VITDGLNDFNSNRIHRNGANVGTKESPRGSFLRITARIYAQSRLARRTNRVIKVVQCAQTYVFATYSIRGSEEMRWPLQRSVQIPLKSEAQQWKPY